MVTLHDAVVIWYYLKLAFELLLSINITVFFSADPSFMWRNALQGKNMNAKIGKIAGNSKSLFWKQLFATYISSL
jgi:hypothetical protein